MTFAPIDLPRAADIGIDARVVALVAGITLLTGVIFGLVPALQTLREDLQGWLKEQARGSGAGRTSHRLRRVLVVAEIAMSAALLIGAALLIKSFWRLQTVDPGFTAGARAEGAIHAAGVAVSAVVSDVSQLARGRTRFTSSCSIACVRCRACAPPDSRWRIRSRADSPAATRSSAGRKWPRAIATRSAFAASAPATSRPSASR